MPPSTAAHSRSRPQGGKAAVAPAHGSHAGAAAQAQKLWQAGQAAAAAQRWDDAVAAFTQGTRCAPRDALMWLNLARAQMKLKHWDAGGDAAQRAFDLDRANVVACRALAECLLQQRRHADAVAAFEALAPTAPRDHEWWSACGGANFQLQHYRAAIDCFMQALALKVDDATSHYRMGLSFRALELKPQALECLRTAALLDDRALRSLALSVIVQEERQALHWHESAAEAQALLAAVDDADVERGAHVSPFVLLALDSAPAQQRRAGALRTWGLTQRVVPLPPPGARAAGRIRLGYLGSDFYSHATAVLIAELLERSDRSRFEVFIYSHSPDDGSAIGQRVRAACEHFVDVSALSNEQIATRMRADGIDIAIDLKSHTQDTRFELLAWRPAPVQATFLGYPGTTGADFIDYIIGDAIVTPLARAADFSEKIAQLPSSYQPNDRQRPLPPAPTRAAVGLPDDAVVLCCFNQTYKLTPRMLDLWAEILQRAPAAVLWMLAWNPSARERLLQELQRRGVAAERIFFAPKRELADHLARLRCADLFLDTWPCNAHTTASDALWAAVPVLTVPGPTFASRVAASLVSACGLPDLACADERAYVETAVALAHDAALLGGLKAHLEHFRLELPLFDSDRYARDYEALLLRMHQRQLAGLAPEHLPAQPTPRG